MSRRARGRTFVDLLLRRVKREVADIERRALAEKRPLAMPVELDRRAGRPGSR